MPPEPDKKKPDDNADDNAPKFITEEQFGELFNRAFTSQWKKYEKQLQSGQEKFQGDLLTKLDERFAQLKPPPSPSDDKQTAKDPEVKKQLEDMAAKLEASEKRFAESERARAEIERQRLFENAKTTLTGALKEKAHPDYLDDWVRAVEPRLQLTNDGSATLKIKHSPYKGSPEVEEDLPLDQAVPKLLERPEFKKYQAPPAPPEGKGGRAPRSGPGNGTPRTNSDNPIDRVAARLGELGMSFDEEFGG
jgi:hypothetical protein